MDDEHLTDTERRLVAAAADGEELELRPGEGTGDAALDDPGGRVDWPSDRAVRADVL